MTPIATSPVVVPTYPPFGVRSRWKVANTPRNISTAQTVRLQSSTLRPSRNRIGSIPTTRPSTPHRKMRPRHASSPIHQRLASGRPAASETGTRASQAPTLRSSAQTQLAAVTRPWVFLESAPATTSPPSAP
jgi:hypothetical protein